MNEVGLQSYLKILAFLTRLSLKYGLVGDLALTLFAFIWMFWPLFLVYHIEAKIIFYIPATIFSLIFLIKGYFIKHIIKIQ